MAVSGDSTKPIIVAIVANFIIAIAKTVGFFFSGSSALLSEAIHSAADVMNQFLLYVGIKKGKRAEDDLFHYGYSQERFFWNLVSAIGIFVLGCGVTVYHGVHDLLHGGTVSEGGTTQRIIEAILLISLLVESYSFYVVIKEIQKGAQARQKPFFAYLKESLDPSVSAVFWEDMAAIVGILLALLGIVMSSLTGSKMFDSIASISIGLLMGWIAYHLAIENKRFLIDRAIPQYELDQLLAVLNKQEIIQEYRDIKTVVLGPDRLKLSGKLVFATDKVSQQAQSGKSEEVAGNTIQVLTSELRRIEGELQATLPALKHIEFSIAS
ncbi:MAG: cation diffusion facilitator family transporter [Spirochaetota bacterium]